MRMPDEEIQNLKKDKFDANIIIPIISDNPNITNYPGFGNSFYYKAGTRVHIHLGIKVESNGWEHLFKLPIGYRPYSIVQQAICGSSLLMNTGVNVSNDGMISVQTNSNYIGGDFEFDAFN